MPFCSNCGTQLSEDMRFCPGCGSPVGGETTQSQPEPIIFDTTPAERSDYSLVLINMGACTKTAAKELLEDIFGYTVTQARKLVDNVPIEAACNMTLLQAQYTAQALSEYGMQVAVYNSDGYVNLTRYAAAPVFTATGAFTAGVAATLATLTVLNRVSVFAPYPRPVALGHIFAPLYRRPAPPPHVRRPRAPASRPAPAPAPRPASRPAPAPAPRPASRPAPAPKPAPAKPASKPAAKPGNPGGGKPGGGKPGGGFGGRR